MTTEPPAGTLIAKWTQVPWTNEPAASVAPR